MGFPRKFYRNVFEKRGIRYGSSFSGLSEEELKTHLSIARYGDFYLTEALRPSYDLEVILRIGFRHDTYHDSSLEDSAGVPVIMVSLSADTLFPVFMELLDLFANVVDVVLETSHKMERGRGHCDLYRENIDVPVLKSILWDFENLLLNDGCTGIAVLDPGIPTELQFDEHKILVAYEGIERVERVLRANNIPQIEDMKFVNEAEHVHSSDNRLKQQFEELKVRLGIETFQS